MKKQYNKPQIIEETIEYVDIIMASSQESGEVSASKGINIGDIFND